MAVWLRIQHDYTQEGGNYRKTITNRAADHATRHSAITSTPTVLEALKRALQELLGSDRWYGTMPMECMVMWIMVLNDGREETIVNEELIQAGGGNKKKEKERKRKSRKERKRMRKYADALRPWQSPISKPITTKSANITARTRMLRRTIRRRAMRLLPPELHRGND
jgi:hypothetical protein